MQLKTAMEKRIINVALAQKCGWVVPDSWINKGRLDDNNEKYLSDMHVAGKSTGWNPFHNKGNSFDLAVTLGITCKFNHALNQGIAWSADKDKAIYIDAEKFESKHHALMYAIEMCAYEVCP